VATVRNPSDIQSRCHGYLLGSVLVSTWKVTGLNTGCVFGKKTFGSDLLEFIAVSREHDAAALATSDCLIRGTTGETNHEFHLKLSDALCTFALDPFAFKQVEE
jgi:hypothetical protein